MASVQTWILSKSKNRRGGFVKRNSSRQGALDGSRARFSREVQGKLRNTMRKPKNGSVEGKDRLRALAAAAARAAGANLTTYFADDDQRPVNPDGGCLCATLTTLSGMHGWLVMVITISRIFVSTGYPWSYDVESMAPVVRRRSNGKPLAAWI